LIVDEEVLFTEALSHVLIEDGILCDAVENCAAALAKLSAPAASYDLVLLCVGPARAKALACLAAVREGDCERRVALIGLSIKPNLVHEAMKLGAMGVLTKDTSLKSLATAIWFMAQGERFIPAGFLPAARRRHAGDDPELSDQEKLILAELARGLKNQEIASNLELTEATVKSQIKTLYRKLNVTNRTKAALIARSSGYI
jgi:DNA-binding NarL/FixJ family response regulator